ncbi:MAG: hypothetical protein LUD69_09105 [Oscillospiraceae bacterium]|nr:hypothetical protein [Oscillospiraceae bacterium]
MSIGLPEMKYADEITKKQTVEFAGYDHRVGAGDGTLWDMENLTGEHCPALASRRPRWIVERLEQPNGLYGRDGLYWGDGTDFYADGTLAGQVEDGPKAFASLGAYVVVLPDKVYYNRLTGAFGSLEASLTGLCYFQDGLYAGEEAAGNTIYCQGANWEDYFSAGDAVSIAGSALEENNATIIVREIEGDYLRFYENSFTVSEEGETLTVSRDVPDLDFLCENENRLWGCKEDTIYASKLGDIFNWNVFDGLSTDSYAVDVGSAGDFTACCSYLGYPCFFKEDHIYKVYGDKPSNFQVMGSANLGVERGSAASCAVAGEVLYYLSRTGVCAWSGGLPQSIPAPGGTERCRHGGRYFVSMADSGGEYHLFVYDTRLGQWHREDALEVLGFGWDGELYFLDSGGTLWLNGDARTVPDGAEEEDTVSSAAEFGDFTEGDPNKKGLGKLHLRLELEEGAEVTVWLQPDGGDWLEVASLSSPVKRSYYLPIVPRRCDHFRIKLTGTGLWKLYSLARESYSGSEL